MLFIYNKTIHEILEKYYLSDNVFNAVVISGQKNPVKLTLSLSGATIKDTWTKPRGGWKQGREVGLDGVGGKGWGENADKCK